MRIILDNLKGLTWCFKNCKPSAVELPSVESSSFWDGIELVDIDYNINFFPSFLLVTSDIYLHYACCGQNWLWNRIFIDMKQFFSESMASLEQFSNYHKFLLLNWWFVMTWKIGRISINVYFQSWSIPEDLVFFKYWKSIRIQCCLTFIFLINNEYHLLFECSCSLGAAWHLRNS